MLKLKKRKINPALPIVLGFLSIILVGTFLLCLPISSKSGSWLPIVDSLFTSTSAVCVTGLIVVDTSIYFSLFGQIVLLILIQIGGLGFIALTSVIFMMFGKRISYGNRVAIQESLNKDTIQGVVKFIKHIVIMVFVIEFIGFLFLLPSLIKIYGVGNGIFRSLFLSVSAFCNAGFNVTDTSIPFQSISSYAQNSLILLPIMFLIVIGGIGYVVLFDIGNKFKKDKKKMSMHSKLVLAITGVLVFSGAILYAIFEWNNPNTIGNFNVWDKIVNSLFLSITPRTAGFSTFDMSALSPQSRILTDFFMYIGGSPVSTAGGIKTTTLFVVLISIFRKSNSKGDIIFKNKTIPNKLIRKATRVACLSILIIFVSTFFIVFCENGLGVESVIFEVISAISTVGISLGITPFLSVFSKLILTLIMFVGRVGALTLAVAFAGTKTNIDEEIEYPNSKIIVG